MVPQAIRQQLRDMPAGGRAQHFQARPRSDRRFRPGPARDAAAINRRNLLVLLLLSALSWLLVAALIGALWRLSR